MDIIQNLEKDLEIYFNRAKDIRSHNQKKVIRAFQKAKLRETHLHSLTGYAFEEPGTAKLEEIYSYIFNTEDALVRTSITCGTHAINIMLFGILRPNDTMLCISGLPYDTIHKSIGISGKNGSSLLDYGINYHQIDLLEDGSFDIDKITDYIEKNKPKMVYIQRSRGYSPRNHFGFIQLKEIIQLIKSRYKDIIIALDNCYGEFVQKEEPTDFGCDIMAGSLIKNPGGSLAKSGGYLVGRKDLIELCAKYHTSPGLGKKVGGSFEEIRLFLQGIFIAPLIVYNAIKTSYLFAKYFKTKGYSIIPEVEEEKNDIVQSIIFNNREDQISFIQSIQKNSAVDSDILPLPWDMPGYDDQIIMASGSFISGSSIELSADGPIREPYIAYVQGGVVYEQAVMTLESFIENRDE